MGTYINISIEWILGILIAIIIAGIGWIIHYVSKTGEKYNNLKDDFNKIDKELFGVRLNLENEINNLKDKISEMKIQELQGRNLPRELKE